MVIFTLLIFICLANIFCFILHKILGICKIKQQNMFYTAVMNGYIQGLNDNNNK